MESNFKLNDRVKYVGKHDPSYPKMIGKLGVVRGIHPNDNDVAHVMFDGAVATLPCAAENLELWPEPPALSPIVTETRRYVKEGDYGILRVKNVSHVKGVVGLYFSPSPFGHYTAEQMRAAAHVLNQIAEVLEENAS